MFGPEDKRMVETLAPVGAAASKELFKKLVTNVYDFVCKKTGRKIRQWNTERKIENLYKKISLVRKVKTIWQVDKPIDLRAFYCDSHIVINNERKCIRQLTDFKIVGNILIEGIAGQGKSIFLRYLCAIELLKGELIPLFIELRRIDRKNSLKERIYAAFEALGLEIDNDIFKALAASGKVILLLDAFDEVPEELKPEVITDIEDLVSSQEGLRIVVTSRPEQCIRVSSHFHVVTLDNLQGDEYAQVIKRLAHGQKWINSLIEHIEKRASHIKEVLCTPLTVTLMVLLYKSYQHLPSKLSEFYDALFQTLLQRHDGTKPGFTRHRSCELDDIQYRSVFEAICILAKKSFPQTYKTKDLYDITKKALSICDLNAKPSAYVDDIVRITCLILREGEEYRFIHNTFQEYYTAAFVRFLLAAHLDFLGITEKQLSQRRTPITPKNLRKLLGFYEISLNSKILIDLSYGGHFHRNKWGLKISDLMRLLIENKTDLEKNVLKGKKHKLIKLSQFLDVAEFRQLIISSIEKYQEMLFKEAKQISHSLKEVESISLLDGLV